jgi:hypothetical protein
MPSPFQRQSQVRKITYAVLIVVLFTATLFWRQVVAAQADTLSLREEALGEVEMTGSVIRLSLVGSRGAAICVLWQMWHDRSRRQEWNELELLTAAITKLQPHYITPWLFHGWHLAYNVSVECDRPRDKYYFISRGIDLTAQGVRQNRNNPDLRFELGFYYQNKLGVADENNFLRTLFQMSCIDPVERDPKRLRKANGTPDLEKFEAFCRKQPHLVRRLRETLGYNSVEEVLDFLEENYEVPSRYDYPPNRTGAAQSSFKRLKQPEQQFPVLPRRAELQTPGQFTTGDTVEFPMGYDNYAAAHVWYVYAQEPLPPPNPSGDPFYDDATRAKYRVPRRMATILFRQYPCLSQTFLAQRLQREGWFDGGWEVDAGRQGRNRWFGERKVVIGEGTNWAGESWEKARDLWEAHGRRTGLYLDPPEKQRLQGLAEKYRKAYAVAEREQGPEPLAGASEEIRAGFTAHRQLYWHVHNRQLANYAHFLAEARVEATPEAIRARRTFYQAEQQRRAAEPTSTVMRIYEAGFALWKKILEDNEDFRADLDVQEQTYKLQHDYLKLIQEDETTRYKYLKPLFVLEDFLAQGIRPAGATLWLPPVQLVRPRDLGAPVVGPFDGNAQDGKPFFAPEAIRRAREHLRLTEPAPTTPNPRNVGDK